LKFYYQKDKGSLGNSEDSDPCSPLVGIKPAWPLWKSIGGFSKVKHGASIYHSNPALGTYPKETKLALHREAASHVLYSQEQNMETTQHPLR
jgi:hypothetical protein